MSLPPPLRGKQDFSEFYSWGWKKHQAELSFNKYLLNDWTYEKGFWKRNWFSTSMFSAVQVSPVAQLCPTLCDPMNHSTPGLHVHHQLLEFTQTHVHRVGDAIQPSHPLQSPSPPAPKSLPASGSFPMGQLFTWSGQSTGVSALASFLPKNTQDWSPLEWTGW